MPLGSIDVAVDPDLSRFFAEVSRATAALTADIAVTADTSAAVAEMAAATTGLTAEVDVELDRLSAEAAEAALSASVDSVSARVVATPDLVSAAAAEAAINATVGTITAEVRADADLSSAVTASRALQGAASAATGALSGAGGLAGGLGAVVVAAAGAAVAVGGIAAGLFQLAQASSDVAEAQNVVAVTFGQGAGDVQRFAEGAAQSIGQSESAALGALGTFGAFGKQAGLTGDELAEFSTGLLTLTSDAASFKNTSPEDAVEAFGAALRGESEPIRRYNVLLDEATVTAAAYAAGIAAPGEELTQQQKVLARYQVILAQTTDLQGDFARTVGESVPNQLRVARAELNNFAADLGALVVPSLGGIVAGLGPVIEQLRGPLSEIVSAYSEGFALLAPSIGKLGVAIAGVFAKLAPLLPPLFEIIGEVISGIAEGIEAFIDSGGLDFLVTGFRAVLGVFKLLVPAVGAVLVPLGKVAGFIAGTFADAMLGGIDLILTGFETIISVARTAVEVLPDSILPDGWTAGFAVLEDKVAGARESVADFGAGLDGTGDSAFDLNAILNGTAEEVGFVGAAMSTAASDASALSAGFDAARQAAKLAADAAVASVERYQDAFESIPSIAEIFAASDDNSAENAITGAADRVNELNRRAFGIAVLEAQGFRGILSEALQVPPEKQGDFISQILTMPPGRQLELEAQTQAAQAALIDASEQFALVEGQAIGAALNYGFLAGLIDTGAETAKAAESVGAQVAAGFALGVNGDGAGAQAGGALGRGIAAAARAALGVRSPSRVFEEIGRQVTAGLVAGIDSSASLAVASVADMAAGMSAVPIKFKPLDITPSQVATTAQTVDVLAGVGAASSGAGVTIDRQIIYTSDPTKAADESIRLARRAAWEGA